MIGLLIFILLMSSWSFFFAVYFDKDYRETLPISVVIWVVFLLIFGVIFSGNLNIGVYIELGIAFITYVISAYKLIKEKQFKNIINRIINLPIILFGIYVVLCYYCLRGIMFTECDEFSHWGDVVKVMTLIKDFSTSPISDSMFKSYPPGMAIIQYICEELVMSFGYDFQEWVCYFCYDVCILLFALPFFKEKNNKFIFSLVSMQTIITVTLLFFENKALTSIYIDPILALIAGYCIASTICAESKWDYFYTFSLLAFLVILKDSGMLFAVFGSIALIAKYELSEKKVFNRIKFYVCLALSIFTTKLTWMYSVKSRNVSANFSNKYDFVELFKIISGQDTSYKPQVLSNYFSRFLSNDLYVINLDEYYSNIATIIVGVVIAIGVLILLKQKTTINKKQLIVFALTISLLTIIYIVGMGLTYVFKFSEYEALNLASFNRYINTLYCCVYIISIALLTRYFDLNYKVLNICILSLVMICPREYYSKLIKRKYANKITINAREEYAELSEKISYLDDDAKIYVISQESSGYDRLVLRYNSRPRTTSGGSIGIPFYEGDIWTINYTCDEFINMLIENDYDYLALYKINDYFIETYGSLFEGEIKENYLYRIDKVSDKLYLAD